MMILVSQRTNYSSFLFICPSLSNLTLIQNYGSNQLVHDKKWTRITKLPTVSHIQLTIPLMECYGQSLIELTLPCAIVNHFTHRQQQFDATISINTSIKTTKLYDKGENQFSTATAIRFNFTDLLEL
jgi:hypothetical protein